MKRTLLKYRTKKSLKNSKSRSVVPFSKAQNIGIIVSKLNENEIFVINEFIDKISNEGKKVSIITYDNRKENPQLTQPYDIITKKDITWNGKFKDDSIKKFIKTEFDYLISLNTSSILPLDNIIAGSKAKCRIGLYRETKNNMFELIINPNPNATLKEKLDQMYSYTKKLRN